MMISTMHIDVGGPDFVIQVNGMRHTFEMHPIFGPHRLNKDGSISACQPQDFLEAASLWDQQGQKVEDCLCVWFHKPKEILRHLGGRNYEITGYEPAIRGS